MQIIDTEVGWHSTVWVGLRMMTRVIIHPESQRFVWHIAYALDRKGFVSITVQVWLLPNCFYALGTRYDVHIRDGESKPDRNVLEPSTR